MSKLLELVDSVFGLKVWIIPGTYGSHTCRFVSSVGLGRILKIRIWASGTINTDVTSHIDVGASMRFAHDCYHGNLCRERNTFEIKIDNSVKSDGDFFREVKSDHIVKK